MLSMVATVVGVFLFALPTVGFAKAVLLTAMLHILSFLVGTVGVFLGFPALALGTLTSVTLREERNQMGGLIPGTIGHTVFMTGTWAIQRGVE